MEFHYIAEKTNFIPIKPYPVSSLDFEHAKIDSNAKRHNMHLSISHLEGTAVKIDCKEDNNHIAHVVLIGKQASCSCKEYYDKSCGYCKHMSIVRSVLKTEPKTDFVRCIATRKLIVPKNKQFRIFNSKDNVFIETGNGDLVDWTFGRKLKENKIKFEEVNLPAKYELPDNIVLFDYQVDILGKMLRAKRALCCMTMGAGKTILSIAGIKELNTNNILIIAPKSIIRQWQKELKRLLNKDSILITGKNIQDIDLDIPQITTYQTIVRNKDAFNKRQYKLIIADEIQYIRNSDSKTWSAIHSLNSEYIWGLSGTIIENELDDLYNVMQIVNPMVLGPEWQFNDKFKTIKSITKSKILYHKQCKNIDMLKSLIKDYVFAYDKINLKPANEKEILVDMSHEQKSNHDSFFGEASKLISQQLNSGKNNFSIKARIQALLLKTRQCCNSMELIDKTPRKPSPKIGAVLGQIKSLTDTGQKIVVYSEWTEMLDILTREINELKIRYVKFHGQLSFNNRIDAIERFLYDPECKIFLSSDAGGLGIDGLQTVCNHMIHIELPWNPAKLDQRIGRLNRLGQKKEVFVYKYIARDSIESNNIYNNLKDKKNLRMDVIYG